jgi:transcriptional regulator with XRE-family HTH domain
MAFKAFGEAFKAHRLAQKLSLRQFCKANEIDAANVSKLERGLLLPPKHEKLHAYAKALKLAEGSDAWLELFDLAAAAKGEFPADLRDEELLTQLPALFRTIRGDPPSDEQLNHILALLRKR